ncbi:hypothetical protein CAPTEDRAFT_207119 [Capitella teleta]|uniref:G-protein coupled receptors family 1 profile domain-containing protein n=1 Tax=Capitella teleta TaxID=283909 RepID=R7VDM8_CAPTE|nr:hypothetical protein CAPTEDRAFT_207119 [Capitella teleta]|eukprot:ELU14421.1 hypothetical protein CAPTEDRAFT_207119 [Capitella teleta]
MSLDIQIYNIKMTDSSTMDEMVTLPVLTTAPPDNDDDRYYKIAEDLFIAVSPIILIVGLVGNILTLVVMNRPSHRSSSVSIYLSTLAISDSLVLILDFINNWFKMNLDIKLLEMDETFCKFHRCFFDAVFTTSSWLILAVSIERFIAVWFPLKAKRLCTIKTARITCCVLPLLALACYAHRVPGWHLDKTGRCNTHPKHRNFQEIYVPWLSAVLYSYGPIVMLIVFNGLIVFRLKKMASKRDAMTSNDKSSSQERRITITIVVICVAFILLTLPLALFYIFQFAMGEFFDQRPTTALAETIVLILGLSNHAVNFFLYVMSSAGFRAEVRRVVCFCRTPTRNQTSNVNSTDKSFSTERISVENISAKVS